MGDLDFQYDALVVLRVDLALAQDAALAAQDISGEEVDAMMWQSAPTWIDQKSTEYKVSAPRMRQVDVDKLPAKLDLLTSTEINQPTQIDIGHENRFVFDSSGDIVAGYVFDNKIDHVAILEMLGLSRKDRFEDHDMELNL